VCFGNARNDVERLYATFSWSTSLALPTASVCLSFVGLSYPESDLTILGTTLMTYNSELTWRGVYVPDGCSGLTSICPWL
jgi:hypothetical protein